MSSDFDWKTRVCGCVHNAPKRCIDCRLHAALRERNALDERIKKLEHIAEKHKRLRRLFAYTNDEIAQHEAWQDD